jgi:predicted nucleotidyltransferase component of viral defense system
MIPRPVLAAWRRKVPWRDDRQVAQDLLLSLLAIRVANDPLTSEHLVWRGGTCLHKLHLDRPWRYSEDLDYVLLGEAGHGRIKDALTGIIADLGMECTRADVSGSRVNVWASAEVGALSGPRIKVKFEVNCNDAPPVLDLVRIQHEVKTRLWDEDAQILTFQAPEIVGTKFRALAQRRKGRDLSDLWLARRELGIQDAPLATAADHYLAHEGIAPATLRERLADHVTDPEFCNDLKALTAQPYPGFDVSTATRELIQWTDEHLDQLYHPRRSRNAVRRDQQRWAREGGWAPGKVRCLEFERDQGKMSRCKQWIAAGESCPIHPR